MATTTAPAAPTALPSLNIDFATLETLVEQGLPFIAKLYPPLAPFQAPLTTLARDLLAATPGSGPFAGAAMLRFGIRRTVLFGLGLLACGVVLSTQITQPWHLMLTWGLIVRRTA